MHVKVERQLAFTSNPNFCIFHQNPTKMNLNCIRSSTGSIAAPAPSAAPAPCAALTPCATRTMTDAQMQAAMKQWVADANACEAQFLAEGAAKAKAKKKLLPKSKGAAKSIAKKPVAGKGKGKVKEEKSEAKRNSAAHQAAEDKARRERESSDPELVEARRIKDMKNKAFKDLSVSVIRNAIHCKGRLGLKNQAFKDLSVSVREMKMYISQIQG